jgi:hypothetical protein
MKGQKTRRSWRAQGDCLEDAEKTGAELKTDRQCLYRLQSCMRGWGQLQTLLLAAGKAQGFSFS